MPWKASSVMEERLRFVARLLDGTRPRETPLGIGHDRACPPALPVQRRAQRMRPANNSASRTCDPLRHAAACHVRHRRMSERACHRFTAIRQLMLGPACARALSFQRLVHGRECGDQRQPVALSIHDFRQRSGCRPDGCDRYFESNGDGGHGKNDAPTANRIRTTATC